MKVVPDKDTLNILQNITLYNITKSCLSFCKKIPGLHKKSCLSFCKKIPGLHKKKTINFNT